MDQRMVEFIAALRSSGVRISIAESTDALRAIEHIDMINKPLFQSALQTVLIKESRDRETFYELFPMYFGSDTPPMQQPGDNGLSEEEQRKLQEMFQQMLAGMTPEQLKQLFEAMMSGQQMDQQEIRNMMQQSGIFPMPRMSSRSRAWMTHCVLCDMRFDMLEEMLAQLIEQLREAGVSEEALQQIVQAAHQNQQALAEQIEQQVGRQMLEESQRNSSPRRTMDEMLDRPFESMKRQDVDELRRVVQQLAARIRSRAALRQRRGKAGTLDAKHTIRTSLQYGGVPIVMRHRRRHLKPKIVILCDLSYSMRPVASFTLLLIYALHDQISRTRSFAYIDDLTDISTDFAELRPEQALEQVMDRVRPPGSYMTDLGNSLKTFVRDHLHCIDHRTTFIVLGDGRNNYRNPHLKAFDEICRRTRRVIWFNPEAPYMWGQEYPDTLNSDMLEYAELCDAVHHVSNVRQLIAAVETLFVGR